MYIILFKIKVKEIKVNNFSVVMYLYTLTGGINIIY